jgi:hypothetical protein
MQNALAAALTRRNQQAVKSGVAERPYRVRRIEAWPTSRRKLIGANRMPITESASLPRRAWPQSIARCHSTLVGLRRPSKKRSLSRSHAYGSVMQSLSS